MHHFHVAESDISVVPLGFMDERYAAADEQDVERLSRQIDPGFILYVGRFHGRKNLERLLQAVALLKAQRGKATRLVLVGRDLWHRDGVMRRIQEYRLEDDVLCPGHVSDAALEMLYRRARVFAYPSLHEGFGMPPLEAMARGLPVLSSNISAMPEVLGDAALLVDPHDPESIAHGLDSLLHDEELRERCIARGRERVAQYSWAAAARATLAVYASAVEDRRPAR